MKVVLAFIVFFHQVLVRSVFGMKLNAPLFGQSTFLTDSLSNSQFASAVQGIGDFNGDGYDDYAVSAPSTASKGKVANGNVYVVFGSNRTALSLTTNEILKNDEGLVIHGEGNYDRLGFTIGRAGKICSLASVRC